MWKPAIAAAENATIIPLHLIIGRSRIGALQVDWSPSRGIVGPVEFCDNEEGGIGMIIRHRTERATESTRECLKFASLNTPARGETSGGQPGVGSGLEFKLVHTWVNNDNVPFHAFTPHNQLPTL